MTNKKYTLTKNTKTWLGTTLYQIKALKDFGSVSEGELGGYIEKKENLSAYGNAWVFGDARVFGDASVSGDASIYGNAWVYGDASISGDAWVYDDARVSKSKHSEKVVVLHLSKDNLTIDGEYVHIGCKCYAIKQWLKVYKKVGTAEGYSEQQIKEYGAALKMISEVYSPIKCEVCGTYLTPAQAIYGADDSFDVCCQSCYNVVTHRED